MNQDLEAKVKEFTSMCMKQKSELSRLVEENERISDQLASQVKRPAAEGQEANGNSSSQTNGNHHHEKESEKAADDENPWHKKYLAISQEHEQTLKEKDVILQKMHTVESHYQTQVSKLEADLEDQRAKNNVSSSHNYNYYFPLFYHITVVICSRRMKDFAFLTRFGLFPFVYISFESRGISFVLIRHHKAPFGNSFEFFESSDLMTLRVFELKL